MNAFSCVGKHFSKVFVLAYCLVFASASFASPQGTCTPEGAFCVFYAPTDMPIEAVGRYLSSAKRSIRIATYNMDVKEYVGILKAKLQQNVKIEFLVDHKLSQTTNLVWNSLNFKHANLHRYRLPVMRGGNPQMHNKVIIIDDEVVLMGSANFTYSGLVANYENVLAIRDPSVIAKYNAELDELRDQAQNACAIFAADAKECGSGFEVWDAGFNQFLVSGVLNPALITTATNANCAKFGQRGLFDSFNQPWVRNAAPCFTDARYAQLVARVSAREQYVDGSFVQAAADRYAHVDGQSGTPTKVYFSPEDNLEGVIIGELEKTLKNPAASFVYVATNFITNKNLALTLVKLHAAGVRMKIFFDAGRLEDDHFQQQIETLKPLGFTQGEKDVSANVITVFKNTLTGPYGCNHNKFAVVGSPDGLVLLNGSANWSAGAMRKNDENLIVTRDYRLGAIYLREMLNQLLTYRYFQDENSAGFRDDLAFLTDRVPCMKALLGIEESCAADVAKSPAPWVPTRQSSVLLSVGNVPANPQGENVWAWVPQLNNNKGGAVQLFTHNEFGGRWLTAIALPMGWKMNVKLFKAASTYDPNRQGLEGVSWEPIASDRVITNSRYPLHVIRGMYSWGVR